MNPARVDVGAVVGIILDYVTVALDLTFYRRGSLAKLFGNTYFATALTLILSYMLCLAGYMNIWPLFGAANQLLSALVLIALAVFLRTTGRKGWMLYVPMVFMFLVTMSALVLSVMGIYGKLVAGNFLFMVDGLQLIIAVALMTLAVLVVKHCGKELITGQVETEDKEEEAEEIPAALN